MKKLLFFLMFIMLLSGAVVVAQDGYDESKIFTGKKANTETTATNSEQQTAEDAEQKKVNTLEDKINAVHEVPGKAVVGTVDGITEWIRNKSGNRIRARWGDNPKRKASESPDHYGLGRDPASGV